MAKKKIELTIKEAEQIMDCLLTLDALGGTCDEDFNAACKRASKLAGKLFARRFKVLMNQK